MLKIDLISEYLINIKISTWHKILFFSVSSILSSLKDKPDIFITRNFFTSFLLVILNKKHILELHHSMEIESRIVQFITKKTGFLNSKKF